MKRHLTWVAAGLAVCLPGLALADSSGDPLTDLPPESTPPAATPAKSAPAPVVSAPAPVVPPTPATPPAVVTTPKITAASATPVAASTASAPVAITAPATVTVPTPAPAPAAAPSSAKEAAEALASTLKWRTGTITLKGGLAKLTLSKDYRYLDHEDAEKVLHQLWGNPADPDTLGMIFPAKYGPLDLAGWAIAIEYEPDGYVKDDDAAKIDYAALLKQMQQQTQEQNPERQKQGYPAQTLVGWAAPPRYDAATHKLYWAKELHFGTDQGNTLNYNIRVLGRRGVLVLNAIASMDQFPEVNGQTPKVLSMVDFEPGNLYADFDPKIDKIATYGLATLIAGGALGVAAKVGLLKGLWVGLLALKKFLIIAVLGVVAFFKKFFAKMTGRVSSKTPTGLPPQQR